MDDIFEDAIYCREDEICIKIKTTKLCLPVEASDTMELANGEIATIKAGWGEKNYPDARETRDKIAIQLEELEYRVTKATYDFTSLAGEKYYKLEAKK